jgi:hypothetical protein
MTGGGWTMVANQIPGSPLPNNTGDVSPASFGTVTASWRYGNARIMAIQPKVAWRLTDASNAVYFKPTCVIDWTHDYINQQPSDCTTGYTTTAFTTAVNGGWKNVATRGIGINDVGAFCSIRAFESYTPDPVPVGAMADCNYDMSQRVSLSYQ